MRTRFALGLSFFAFACKAPSSDVRATSSPEEHSTTTASSSSSSAPPSAVASAIPVVDGPCPATDVRIDGKPFTPKTAHAYGFATGPVGAFVLVLSSKNVDCATLLSGSRPVANDEDYVEVGAGPVAIQRFVNAQNEHAAVVTEIVRAPKKAGDSIEICVRAKATLHTSMVKTSTIEVTGLVRGTYCGETK